VILSHAAAAMNIDVTKKIWLWLVLAAGLGARFWCATLGHNYDLDSYRIVADLMAAGKNVYAGTDRYNYGPVWFNVIHLLDWLAGHDAKIFRWLLVGVLSAADAGIFFVLRQKFGVRAAVFFFLNPVSIIITGYHNQFDNVAVLLGLAAVLVYGDDHDAPLNRRKWQGLFLLSLSLMTKHVFFLFPLWLAVKQRGFWQKVLVVIVPAAIFLAGFIPYWPAGHQGIMDNVFAYHSHESKLFYNFFLPAMVTWMFDSRTVWMALIIIFALVCRRRPSLESLLIYTGLLVATSPATTNQYLAIPIAMASAFPNPLFWLYSFASTVHLCTDSAAPHFGKYAFTNYDDLAIYTLTFALVWFFWREPIRAAARFWWLEAAAQFKRQP
jgi:hypothetical protein